MENMFYIINMELAKFVIIALDIVIVILAFVIVALNVCITNLRKEIEFKEKVFERRLRQEKENFCEKCFKKCDMEIISE